MEAELQAIREQAQLLQANFTQSQINLKVTANQYKTLEAKLAELTSEKRVRREQDWTEGFRSSLGTGQAWWD